MALSALSKHCIGMATFLFAFNVFHLVMDLIHEEPWRSHRNIWNRLGSETFLILYYFAGTAIFSLVYIVGVIKRNIFLTIPVVLTAPIALFFNEHWWDVGRDWYLVYGAIFFGLLLVLNPVVCVWREMLQERTGKLKKQERV